MAKLQKHKAYVYTSGAGVRIPHFKHQVNIPDEYVEELGWSEGQELEFELDGQTLRIVPRKSP